MVQIERKRLHSAIPPPLPPPPFYNLTNAPEWNWSKLQNQPALYSFPNIYTVWISNHEHHDLQCKHGNQWKVKFSGQVTVRNFQEKEAVGVCSVVTWPVRPRARFHCETGIEKKSIPCMEAVATFARVRSEKGVQKREREKQLFLYDKRFNDWVGLSKAGLSRKILCFRS